MVKYCNNPDCEAYKRAQEGKHCAYCGEKLISDDATESSKKEISGDGISVSRVTNDSHDTISNTNTTIVLNGKTLEDLTLKERKAAYRKYCSERIKNGIITPSLRRNLDEYALELELSTEVRKEIEKTVRENSAVSGYDLTSLDRDNLDLIKASVSNNKIRINDMLPKLEAMATSDDDEIQFYLHLLLVCSSPASIIRKYADREQDTYWMTFWSNVAYVKNGQKVKAEQALRELSAWDTQSQDNLYLLQATGALLSDDLDTASMFFSRGKNYSYLLDPLAKTVSYILKAKGVRRLSNSSEVNFYLEKLFGLKEETPDTVSYRAPIPDPLRERIDGKRAPTPVAASSVAPSTHVPSPAPSPKSHSSGFLGILAVIAVVVAIVIFVPKNKKDNTPQTPAETIITSNTPAQSAPASTEVSKSTPAKTTSGNKGSSSNSSSGTTQITSNPDKASSSGGAATTSTNTSNSSSVGASSGQTQTQPSAPSQAKTDPVAELKAAAEGGNKDAQYELGMKYYDGNGVSKNYATAFQYLKPLADAGYTKAYFPVAEMYHGGRGVAKDRDAAEAWYTKAANAGNAKAKSILLNSF